MAGMYFLIPYFLFMNYSLKFVRYFEVTDTKEFFTLAKKSPRMVAHFYRRITPRCEIVDAHFHKLALSHVETLFVKIDVEKHTVVLISPTFHEKLCDCDSYIERTPHSRRSSAA